MVFRRVMKLRAVLRIPFPRCTLLGDFSLARSPRADMVRFTVHSAGCGYTHLQLTQRVRASSSPHSQEDEDGCDSHTMWSRAVWHGRPTTPRDPTCSCTPTTPPHTCTMRTTVQLCHPNNQVRHSSTHVNNPTTPLPPSHVCPMCPRAPTQLQGCTTRLRHTAPRETRVLDEPKGREGMRCSLALLHAHRRTNTGASHRPQGAPARHMFTQRGVHSAPTHPTQQHVRRARKG